MANLTYQLLGNFIAMFIPLLSLVLLIESKNGRRIILFFCWGVFAGMLAFNLNNYFDSHWGYAERLTLSIAPLTEEIIKGLPILLFMNRRKYPQISKVVIYCAMASGIGFSIQESMYYFTISAHTLDDVAALVVRTFTTALLHGMTTAAIGIGLLLYDTRKQVYLTVPLVLALIALSVSVHSLYNLLLYTNFAVLALLMPLIMLFAGWWFVRNYDR